MGLSSLMATAIKIIISQLSSQKYFVYDDINLLKEQTIFSFTNHDRRESGMNNKDIKIEFSQSDVLNALLHSRQQDQHFATQESVDNLKERVIMFESKTDESLKDVRNELKEQSSKMDKLFFLIFSTLIAGFAALYFK